MPIIAEVVLGFGFSWTTFQALFMGEMFGSYARALKGTFTSELLSMNCLVGDMIPVTNLALATTRHLTMPPSRCFGSACR